MKKLLTKSLVAFLTIVMVVTAIPMNAFAVNENAGVVLPSTNDDLVIQSSESNALGNVISQSIDNEVENQTADYIINWVEAKGTSVTVEFSCYDTCNLVVAIYTEEGRMIGSANMEVTSEMVTATLDVAVKNLPEYYLIKAFLLDSEMYAKCDEYVCTYYTRDYQEFLSLTVDDFPEENVINLDESKDNNFAVVRGDAIIAEPGEDANILLTRDDENLVYTFENPDAELSDISTADILFYPIDDYDFILIKVLKAENKGDVITVYGESEATEEDLFSLVKIDFTSCKENTTIDTSNMDPELTYMGETDYDDPYDDSIVPMSSGWEEEKEMELGTWNFGFKPTFGSDAAGISGSSTLGVTASAELKYYFSSKVKDIYFKVITDLSYNVEIVASLSKNFSVCSVEISFYKIIAIGLNVNFTISVTGKIGFGGSVRRSVGVSYINKEFRRIDEKQNRLTPAVEVSAVARVGLEIGVYVRVLTVKFSLNAQVGFEAKVVGTNPSDTFVDGDDVKHMCGFCFEGDVSFYVALTFKIDFLILKDKEYVLLEERYPIFVFHSSQDSSGGDFVFEKTACTNKLYKQSFTVKTVSGQFVEGAAVKLGSMDTQYTDEYGTCYFYCDKGDYTLSVKKTNFSSVSQTVKAQRKPNGIVVELESNIIESIDIISDPYKKDYYTGDIIDSTGLKVVATFYDGRTKEVSDCSVSPQRLLNSGKQEITVSYQGCTDTFEVDVTRLQVVSSKVISVPKYYINDYSDKSDLVLELMLNNGTTQKVSGNAMGVSVSPYILTETGKQTITVDYYSAEIDVEIDVIPVTGISIGAIPQYYAGDSVLKGTLLIEVGYADGTKRVLPGSSYGMSASPKSFFVSGSNTANITYEGYSVEFTTQVSAVWLERVSVECGYIIEYYNNGTQRVVDDWSPEWDEAYSEDQYDFDIEDSIGESDGFYIDDIFTNLQNNTIDIRREVYRYGEYTNCIDYPFFDINKNPFIFEYGCSTGPILFDPLKAEVYCFGKGEFDINSIYNLLYNEDSGFWYEYKKYLKFQRNLEISDEELMRFYDHVCYGLSLYLGEGITKVVQQEQLFEYDQYNSYARISIPKKMRIKNLYIPSTLIEMPNILSHCWSDSWNNVIFSDLNNNNIKEINDFGFPYDQETVLRLDKLSKLESVRYLPRDCSDIYLPTSLESLPAEIQLCSSVHIDISVDEWLEYNVAAPEELYLNEEIVIEIPEGTKVIADHPFANCATVKKVILPQSIQDVGEIFKDCIGIEELYYSGTLEDWCALSFSSYLCNPAYYAKKLYINNKLIEGMLKIPDGVTIITNSFAGYDGVMSLVIPAGVETIGNAAFRDCDALTSISISDGVTTIGNSAFYSCDVLAKVVIPNSVKSIGDEAFRSCSKLTSVTIGNSVETIGDSAFRVCDSLTSVIIGNSVETIGDSAFRACDITQINIPSSVKTIGNSAFYYCNRLTSIAIPDSVTTIGESAFEYCNNLTNVKIGNGVEVIGSNSFSYCEKLSVVTIGNGVEEIGNYAFYYCKKLASVTIPDSTKTIGDYAFYNCISLTKLTIGNGVEKIGNNAFRDCGILSNLTIGSKVKTIGAGAFGNCDKLSSVIIPDSVEMIGASVFSDCNSLSSLTIGNSVKTIGEYAFDNCDKLTIVIVPHSVEALGAYAFRDCDALKTLTFGNSVEIIGNYAFYDCDSLISMTIPDSVETIDDYAFYSCDQLQTVVFERNSRLGLIDQYAFAYCVSLEAIDVPTSVHTIGYRAFYGCTKLNKIVISDEIEDIGSGAFDGCDEPEIDYGGTQDEWDNLGGGASQNNPGVNYETGTNDYTAITASASGAILGNLYTLVVFNNYTGSYDLLKLSYVATQTADSSEIKFTFIPKRASNITIFIMGEFENGDDQGDVSLDEVKTEKTVRAESVSLSADQLDLYAWYNSAKLTATVLPEDTHIKDVLWTSSNPEVAQVDSEGNVHPQQPGTAVITVKTADGGFTDECTVNVTELKFNITWNINGENVEQTVGYKTEITPPEVPGRTGYTFTGWDKGIPKLMPKTDLTFTALYKADIINATFNANSGKWANGAEVIAVPTEFDAEIVLTEKPVKQGYVLSGWILDGKSVESFGIMDSVNGKAFTAAWKPAEDTEYTVETYMMDINGEYVSSTQKLTDVTDKTVNAEYTVSDGFTLNREKSVLSGEVAPDGSLVLKVYIDRNKYKLITYIDSDKKETELYYGVPIAVENPTNKVGYTFKGWSGEIPETMPAKDLEFTAQWAVNPHTVTWIIDGEKNIHNYEYGDTIKIPEDPEKPYYTFNGWSPAVPDMVPDEDLTFYACWTPIIYTVVWIVDDTETKSGYKFGDKINIHPDPEKLGYKFKGWSGKIPEAMPAENLTFRALWTPNAYDAVFDANGGVFVDGVKQKTVSVDFDSTIVFDETPVLKGYRFIGWSVDGKDAVETLGDMDSINGKKFVALWAESDKTPYTVETYTMNSDGKYVLSTEILYGTTNADVELVPEISDGFSLNMESSVLNGKINADGSLKLIVYIDRNSYIFTVDVDGNITTSDYLYGAKIDKPENPTKTGHTFDRWNVEFPDTMPAEDLSVKAVWKVNSYDIIWIVDGEEMKETYNYGSAINKDDPTKKGHTFAGWDKQVPDIMPAENLTFTAQWTVNSYEVIWLVDGVETKENYSYGSEINEPATPIKTGYTFAGWDNTIPSSMPDKNLTFTAQWNINSYDVIWNVDGVETKQTYKFGDKIVVPDNPTKEGHTFVSWSKAVPATMPAEDLTFTVVWDTLAYDVTWIVDGVETKETYNYGSVINKPEAPSKEGYTFTGWDNEIPETMPANSLTFTAEWNINSYDIIWIVDGVETTQNYQFSAEVTALANPTKEGYTFTGWSREIPTTMPAENITITAQWQVNTYTVTWNVDGNATVNSISFGADIIAPTATVKAGYKFAGWNSAVPAKMPAKNLTFTAQYELIVKQLKIKNPSTATINYGETLIMHADLNGAVLTEGWKIQWTVEGAGFNMAPAADGLTCKMTSVANGNATVKATLVDENGEAVLDADGNEMSDTQELKSNASFWQKIVSFFKNLFRINRIIPE